MSTIITMKLTVFQLDALRAALARDRARMSAEWKEIDEKQKAGQMSKEESNQALMVLQRREHDLDQLDRVFSS